MKADKTFVWLRVPSWPEGEDSVIITRPPKKEEMWDKMGWPINWVKV